MTQRLALLLEPPGIDDDVNTAAGSATTPAHGDHAAASSGSVADESKQTPQGQPSGQWAAMSAMSMESAADSLLKRDLRLLYFEFFLSWSGYGPSSSAYAAKFAEYFSAKFGGCAQADRLRKHVETLTGDVQRAALRAMAALLRTQCFESQVEEQFFGAAQAGAVRSLAAALVGPVHSSSAGSSIGGMVSVASRERQRERVFGEYLRQLWPARDNAFYERFCSTRFCSAPQGLILPWLYALLQSHSSPTFALGRFALSNLLAFNAHLWGGFFFLCYLPAAVGAVSAGSSAAQLSRRMFLCLAATLQEQHALVGRRVPLTFFLHLTLFAAGDQDDVVRRVAWRLADRLVLQAPHPALQTAATLRRGTLGLAHVLNRDRGLSAAWAAAANRRCSGHVSDGDMQPVGALLADAATEVAAELRQDLRRHNAMLFFPDKSHHGLAFLHLHARFQAQLSTAFARIFCAGAESQQHELELHLQDEENYSGGLSGQRRKTQGTQEDTQQTQTRATAEQSQEQRQLVLRRSRSALAIAFEALARLYFFPPERRTYAAFVQTLTMLSPWLSVSRMALQQENALYDGAAHSHRCHCRCLVLVLHPPLPLVLLPHASVAPSVYLPYHPVCSLRLP